MKSALVMSVLALGCAGKSGLVQGDAGADARGDAAVDARIDAGVDARVDAGSGSAITAPCGSGTWDNDGNPATACVPWTDCLAGQYVVSDGTATTDRTCAACGSGTFSTTINAASCTPDSPCADGSTLCGVGQPCQRDADCASNACNSVTSTCVADACDDRHRDGNESDVDCGGGVCPPCPANPPVWHCDHDSDCESGLCHLVPNESARICTSSECFDARLDGDESDVDCGGPVCGACLRGQHCNSSFDCQGGTACSDGICGGACVCGARCFACSPGVACTFSDDCASHICDSGTCTTASCSDGVMNGSETDVDCGGNCSPCPLDEICHGDADCQSGACDGVSSRCTTDACADHRRDGDESDVDCGGAACAACPAGSACGSDGDCGSDRCDAITAVCVPPWCLDGLLDGGESDVDCGGACVACSIGAACRVDQDCASSACDALTLRCVASACADHWKDGAETSVDCGGACGSSCASSDECQSDADCAGLACDMTAQVCHDAWCPDGAQDHGESDVDCGAGACAQCALGQHCNEDGDCLSGACDDTSGTCVADHCQDHRVDADESDVDCGGWTCQACSDDQICRSNWDCAAAHVCLGHVCL